MPAPDLARALMHLDNVCKLRAHNSEKHTQREARGVLAEHKAPCPVPTHTPGDADLKLILVISAMCSRPISASRFHFSDPGEGARGAEER